MRHAFPMLAPVLLAGALVAQEEAPTRDMARQQEMQKGSGHYALLETLEGAEVRLKPGGAAAGEAESCTLQDVLFDPESGKITRAVLDLGNLGEADKVVAVQFDRLRWDPAKKRFELSMPEAELQAQPSFDPENPTQDHGRGVTEAGARTPGAPRKVGEMNFSAIRHDFLGDKVDTLELYGSTGDEIGGVSDTVVDVGQGKIAFLIVNQGGIAGIGADRYLVPLEAVTISDCWKDSKEDAEPAAFIEMPESAFEQAPKYEEPDEGVVTQQQVAEAKAAFGGAKKQGHEGMGEKKPVKQERQPTDR